MLRNLWRGLAGAIVAASLAGCGGNEGTTMPASTPPLSSEMQAAQGADHPETEGQVSPPLRTGHEPLRQSPPPVERCDRWRM